MATTMYSGSRPLTYESLRVATDKNRMNRAPLGDNDHWLVEVDVHEWRAIVADGLAGLVRRERYSDILQAAAVPREVGCWGPWRFVLAPVDDQAAAIEQAAYRGVMRAMHEITEQFVRGRRIPEVVAGIRAVAERGMQP